MRIGRDDGLAGDHGFIGQSRAIVGAARDRAPEPLRWRPGILAALPVVDHNGNEDSTAMEREG